MEIKDGRAAFEAGKKFGTDIATLNQAFIQAEGFQDINETYDLLLARPIGLTARDLKLRGVAEDLVEIWIAAAVVAGREHLRRFA